MIKYMYPLFESIKVVDGQLINLEWHQVRMDRSRNKLFASQTRLDLKDHLSVPTGYQKGIVKCRVSYGQNWGPVVYTRYNARIIRNLQQIDCRCFEYNLKYRNRAQLEHIFSLRAGCDEVLITIDGQVTDTSYSNVVCFDGSSWITPDKPLLEGTQRARLLAGGVIKTGKIDISCIANFEKLVLINAMLEFDPERFISPGDVRFWEAEQVVVH